MAAIRENHGKSQRMLLFGVWPLLGWSKKNLGPEMYQKWPGGGIFFCAFGAKIFGDSEQALIRTHPEGVAIAVSSKRRGGTLGQSKNGGGGAF